MPLEVQGHTVPHLKGLMCGKMEVRGLRCGSIFILCHTPLKNAILLHIEATVRIFIGPSGVQGGNCVTKSCFSQKSLSVIFLRNTCLQWMSAYIFLSSNYAFNNVAKKRALCTLPQCDLGQEHTANVFIVNSATFHSVPFPGTFLS